MLGAVSSNAKRAHCKQVVLSCTLQTPPQKWTFCQHMPVVTKIMQRHATLFTKMIYYSVPFHCIRYCQMLHAGVSENSIKYLVLDCLDDPDHL